MLEYSLIHASDQGAEARKSKEFARLHRVHPMQPAALSFRLRLVRQRRPAARIQHLRDSDCHGDFSSVSSAMGGVDDV